MKLNARTLTHLSKNGYARKIMPLIKQEVLKTEYPEGLLKFCQSFLHDPWPEAEPFIARDAMSAFNYAQWILHGRFPMGERAIAMSPLWSALYAMNCTDNQRFIEGEPAIMAGMNGSASTKRRWYVKSILHIADEDYMLYKLGCKYAWGREDSPVRAKLKEAYDEIVAKYGEGIFAPKPEWDFLSPKD